MLRQYSQGWASAGAALPIGPTTGFHLASLTKPFTALAIMMLVERQALACHHRLDELLPEFAHLSRAPTIRHLLNHTSGLADYEDLFDANDGSRPDGAEAVRRLAATDLLFVPGERFEYSNSAYVCLARIVEVVSGMTFARFVREEMFVPLGMESSRFYGDIEPGAQDQAMSYDLAADGYREASYSRLEEIYGAEGIHSTPLDLVKWFHALDTDRLVRRATLERTFESGRLNNGARVGYGLGWFTPASSNLRRVTHTGSCAGFRHLLVYYPDLHDVMLVLSNLSAFDDAARSATALRLEEVWLGQTRCSRQRVEIEDDALDRFVGAYRTGSGDIIEVAVDRGELLVRPPRLIAIALVPTSDDEFVVRGAECDSYVFRADERGRAITMTRYLSLFGETGEAYCTATRVS